MYTINFPRKLCYTNKNIKFQQALNWVIIYLKYFNLNNFGKFLTFNLNIVFSLHCMEVYVFKLNVERAVSMCEEIKGTNKPNMIG